jgi:antitoxin Phd
MPMESQWQLQKAKNQFSELIEKALTEGPQEITKHGKKTAVILSIDEYRRLRRPQGGLVEFFRKSPLHHISFERRKDYPRCFH